MSDSRKEINGFNIGKRHIPIYAGDVILDNGFCIQHLPKNEEGKEDLWRKKYENWSHYYRKISKKKWAELQKNNQVIPVKNKTGYFLVVDSESTSC